MYQYGTERGNWCRNCMVTLVKFLLICSVLVRDCGGKLVQKCYGNTSEVSADMQCISTGLRGEIGAEILW